ncbi:hypothetical protein BLGI_2593 [Brevibacillus laterosporus GI-9]|nr:hypothetical protein BLGI_2593 [Brevibacillus laterosporus GI-9]
MVRVAYMTKAGLYRMHYASYESVFLFQAEEGEFLMKIYDR